MKKGKKYSSTKILFKTLFASGFFYTLIASITTLIVSIIGSIQKIKDGINDGNGLFGLKTLFVVAIAVVAISIAIFGTIKSISSLSKSLFQLKILRQNSWKQEILSKAGTKLTPLCVNNGYKTEEFKGEYYLASNQVDKFIASDDFKKLSLKVFPKKVKFSNKQRQVLYKIVSQKISQGKNIFNSDLVRLRSDMLSSFGKLDKRTDKNTIIVQKTDYFSNISSNDLIYDQIYDETDASWFVGKDTTIDDYNMLYNLSDSPASNIIGVSTLAITSDKKVIFNVQRNKNDVSNDCIVPSGSGSADFDDLLVQDKRLNKENIKICKKNYKLAKLDARNTRKSIIKNKYNCQNEFDNYFGKSEIIKNAKAELNYQKSMKNYLHNFSDFLVKATERELFEELHLPQTAIKETVPCGYIRLFNRGGKPDFFAFSFTNENSSDIINNFKRRKFEVCKKEIYKNTRLTDYNEVACALAVDLDKIFTLSEQEIVLELDKEFKKELSNEKAKIEKLSVQVHYLIELIKNNRELIDKNLI